MRMKNENGIYDKEIEEYYCEDVGILEIKIGIGLVPLCDKADKNDDFLELIAKTREEASEMTGIPIPKIRIRDSKELENYEYVILFREAEVGRWTFKKNHTLFIGTEESSSFEINSSWEKTKEPAFGVEAYFVPEEEVAGLEHQPGLISVSPSVVISTHLKEIILQHRNSFLNHYYVNRLIENVRKTNPDLVSEVILNRKFSITDLKIILNRLISERVPIKDMNTILETVADYLNDIDKPLELAEKVRERLSLVNLQQYATQKKVLHLIRISQSTSETLAENIYFPTAKVEIPYFILEPADSKKIRNAIEKSIELMRGKGFIPIFLCVSSIRLGLASYLERYFPSAVAVSDMDIYALNNALNIEIEGEVSLDEEKK